MKRDWQCAKTLADALTDVITPIIEKHNTYVLGAKHYGSLSRVQIMASFLTESHIRVRNQLKEDEKCKFYLHTKVRKKRLIAACHQCYLKNKCTT